MQITQQEQAMVDAVRKDPKIGRGTCSTVDECYTDSEIVEIIRDGKVQNTDALLTSLYSLENIWRDQADDALAAGGEEQIWGQVTREPDVTRTCKCGRVVHNDFTIMCPACNSVMPAEPDSTEHREQLDDMYKGYAEP